MATDPGELKRLRQRKTYATMRIEVLKTELSELATKRSEILERLRTDTTLGRVEKGDFLSQYLYASERYKDARAELQGLAAERTEINEMIADMINA